MLFGWPNRCTDRYGDHHVSYLFQQLSLTSSHQTRHDHNVCGVEYYLAIISGIAVSAAGSGVP